MGYLNYDSLRNNFIFAHYIIGDFDIFLISESKLEDTFLYIEEQVPCKMLTSHEYLIAFKMLRSVYLGFVSFMNHM